MKKHRAYISGALTHAPNLEELRRFYEAIGQICIECGIEPYIPHKHSDPVINGDLSPQEVHLRDKSSVISADLLIAYAGVPSLGVGMEIAYADDHNVPVLLLYPKDQTVSRMVRGLAEGKLLAEIAFTNIDNALSQLRKVLHEWVSSPPEPRKAASSAVFLRIIAPNKEICITQDIISHEKDLKTMLRRLKREGLVPQKAYVELWNTPHLQEVIKSVWGDIPVYLEYENL